MVLFGVEVYALARFASLPALERFYVEIMALAFTYPASI